VGVPVDDKALLPPLAQGFMALPLALVLRFYGCSHRLANAIERADLGNVSLSAYYNDPSILVDRLRNLQGIGPTTIEEAVPALIHRLTSRKLWLTVSHDLRIRPHSPVRSDPSCRI
jgi:hypothetical protein